MVTLLIATYPNSQAVGDKCSLLGKHLMGKKAEFPNILSTVSGKMLGSLILWKQFERFVQQFLLNKLQCDYYNQGHLEKVNWYFK